MLSKASICLWSHEKAGLLLFQRLAWQIDGCLTSHFGLSGLRGGLHNFICSSFTHKHSQTDSRALLLTDRAEHTELQTLIQSHGKRNPSHPKQKSESIKNEDESKIKFVRKWDESDRRSESRLKDLEVFLTGYFKNGDRWLKRSAKTWCSHLPDLNHSP